MARNCENFVQNVEGATYDRSVNTFPRRQGACGPIYIVHYKPIVSQLTHPYTLTP